MVTNRPADLLIHVRLDKLAPPISMITGDKPRHCNVVQKASDDDLLVQPRLSRQVCALNKMVRDHRREAVPEEIRQPWLGGHLRQSRVIAHHEVAAVSERR